LGRYALKQPPMAAVDTPVNLDARGRITCSASPPLILALLVVTNFQPVETSLIIGGLRLPFARLLLLLLAPYLCLELGRKIAAGRYRFVAADAFVLLAGCWMLGASINVIGLGDALNHAGPEILEFCFGYLATRTLLSSAGQAVSLINLLCVTVAVVGLIAVLDPLTDRFLVHEMTNAITGYGKDVVGRPDYRLGIRRAAGSMEHPILLGTACMIGLLCRAGLPRRGRFFTMGGCAVGLAVSVSSAPLQATILGFGLLLYDRLFRCFRWRWALLFGMLVTIAILSFILFGSPLGFVNQYLIFDPASGFAREFEWQTVGGYIAASPWFGIGFGWDEIAENIGAFASIDSVWLGKALVYGIPCSVLIALTFLGSASLPARGPRIGLAPVESWLATTLSIIMCLLLFLGFTVYFWGSLWILSALLAGVRAHLGELGQIEAPYVVTALDGDSESAPQ
jgi:hypothetical protein